MLTELVDIEYYIKQFGDSSIPGSLFKKYSIKASNKINYYTSNRITKDILNDNIRNAACEIVDLLIEQERLKEQQNNNTMDKVSETVGPHSVTYANKTTLQAQRILNAEELDRECYRICYEHLAHLCLMYRGAK